MIGYTSTARSFTAWVLALALVCCGCGQIDCVICFNSKQSNNSPIESIFCCCCSFVFDIESIVSSHPCAGGRTWKKKKMNGYRIRESMLSHFTLNDFQLMGRRMVLKSGVRWRTLYESIVCHTIHALRVLPAPIQHKTLTMAGGMFSGFGI